ncbi:MAG: hypothetical protein WA431_05570 [Candidatus Cybelea sp.]
MKSLNLSRCAPTCVALALLAGCGGLQPPIGAPGSMPQTSALATHADRGKSWMLPEAKKIKELLYLGDGGDVYVYDYKAGREVGTLTGFNNTTGECVDKKGDVFLTTSISSTGAVLEYKHGGDNPIATFNTDGHPIGCSVDSASDLAVNNGVPGGGSDVEVWKHASGNPTSYENEPDCYQMWPPGYDNKGNLFIEIGPNVCELAAAGTSLISVPFNHYLSFPGSIMWDGKHLALTDGGNGEIYRVKEARKGLDVIGTTQLEDKWCSEVEVSQPFIVGQKNTPINDEQGTVIVGGNDFCLQLSEQTVPIAYWHYGSGGEPYKFAHPRLSGASGQAVSIEP